MGKLKSHKSEFDHIIQLIEGSRGRAFSKVNAELVLLYFNVGQIVYSKIAEGLWGDGTVNELAGYIAEKMPGLSSFNRRGLYRMKQFYETWFSESDCFKHWLGIQTNTTESLIVSSLMTQLQSGENEHVKFVSPVATQLQTTEDKHVIFVSTVLTQIAWSNHLELISSAGSPEEKLFYLLHSIKEKWSRMELRRQLSSGYFERVMLSGKTVSKISTQFPPGIFKDPYIFEFLDLPDTHSETDLEKALVKNLQKFILEIGKGFAYMGNQFHLQVGNKDYFTDLLFYNRDLQGLVLFELKMEEFEPESLGKLNFYLEALDRDVRRPHEKPSVGILLCKGKDKEVVEYSMARSTSPAMIADYETKLIPKKMLANKLHQLVEQLSKNRQ